MKPIFSPAVFNSMQDLTDAGLIKKGDGVTFFHDGQLTWARWPAKGGFRKHGYKSLNKNGEDLGYEGAPWAHTGDAHSDMSPEEGGTSHGIKGSGHKIEGVWEEGKFGEMLERDGTGGFHMHGIDGAIHGIGNLIEDIKKKYPQILEKSPNDPMLQILNNPMTAKNMVQKGISDWNENNPSNIHPEVDSPDLRQKVISSYDKGNNSLRSSDGRFITLFTNADSATNHMGTMVESAALKPHAEISNVVTSFLTSVLKPHVPEAQNNPNWKWNPATSGLNFLHDKQGYVYPDHLSFSMNPVTGEVSSRAKHAKKGDIVGNNFNINESTQAHYKNAGFNVNAAMIDNAADSLIAGDLLHPEFYTEKPDRKGTTRYEKRKHGKFTGGSTMGNLFEMINRILPDEHKNLNTDSTHGFKGDMPISNIDMNNPILDELTWVNDTPKWNPLSEQYEKTDNKVHTLREALESWKDARHIGNPDDFTRSLANDFLYNMDSLLATSTLAGNNSQNNARKEKDGKITLGSRHLRIDNALRDMIGEEGREGVPHLNTQDIFNHSKGIAQYFGGINTSGKVKGMKANAVSAERAAKQQVKPNLNSMEIPEHLKKLYGIDGIVGPHTEKKSNILRFLAGELVSSRGGEPARHLTDEELREIQPLNNAQMTDIKEKHPDANFGVPDFCEHAMVSQNMNTRGGQLDAGGGLPAVGPAGGPAVGPAGGPAVGPAGTARTAALQPNITDGKVTNGKVQVDYGPVQRQPAVGTQGLRSLSPSALQMRQSLMNQPQRGGFGNFMDKIRGRESPQAQADARLRTLMEYQGTNPDTRNPNLKNIDNMEQFRETLSPVERDGREYQQSRLTDYPIQTSADKLIDMMERLQLTDAFADESVLKHVPNNKLNGSSSIDVNLMANNLNITSNDVRTILHSKGDWERIHKKYGYSDTIVKAVKVSFSGGLK